MSWSAWWTRNWRIPRTARDPHCSCCTASMTGAPPVLHSTPLSFDYPALHRYRSWWPSPALHAALEQARAVFAPTSPLSAATPAPLPMSDHGVRRVPLVGFRRVRRLLRASRRSCRTSPPRLDRVLRIRRSAGADRHDADEAARQAQRLTACQSTVTTEHVGAPADGCPARAHGRPRMPKLQSSPVPAPTDRAWSSWDLSLGREQGGVASLHLFRRDRLNRMADQPAMSEGIAHGSRSARRRNGPASHAPAFRPPPQHGPPAHRRRPRADAA